MSEELKIVSAVEMNGGEAYVLNRRPVFKYVRSGNVLYAEDSGIYSIYVYESPSRAFRAFGGREFDLPLADGGVEHCNGQWWDGGTASVEKIIGDKIIGKAYGTEETLKSCYVFYSCYFSLKALTNLRSQYKGHVYPYWDYEKLIKYPELQKRAFRYSGLKQELVSIIKAKHKKIAELQSELKAMRAKMGEL